MKRLVFTGGTLVALAIGVLVFLVTLTPPAPVVAIARPALVKEASAQPGPDGRGTAGQYRAAMFLKDLNRSKIILQFLHYDSTFRGREPVAAENDHRDGGPFTVTIRYYFDGSAEQAYYTDVVFHFTGDGSLDGFKTGSSTAPSHNRPFAGAAVVTLAIQATLFLVTDEDKLSPLERRIYNAALGAKPAEMLLGILQLDQL